MQSALMTKRLTLRHFTAADGDLLCELDSDPAVMRWLNGGFPTPHATIERDILPAFLRSYTPLGFGVWAAQLRDSGDFLGWLSLRPVGDLATEATIGYRLRRAAWGHGYATEGARALIRRAFAKFGVERVTATTYEQNLASRRVMERVGMTLVRRFRLTPAALVAEGDTHIPSEEVWDGDEVEYVLTRAAWERMPHATEGEQHHGVDLDRRG